MSSLRRSLLILLFSLVARSALAHPLAPALLELTENAGSTVSVRWKTSLLRQTGARLQPILPKHCKTASQPRTSIDATSATVTWSLDCGPAGLVGAVIGVDGADSSATDALLRIELADGRTLHAVLRGEQSTFVVPERAARAAVLWQYGALGLHHMLAGFDHLLFVFGLVLLVPGRSMLVKTVTAFTAGHSVTLSVVALGHFRFPSELIEVLIALTILLLAIELEQPHPSFMKRSPWAVALIFGLLHGCGFAGALQEIGLPAGEIPAALFSFNVGIEIGQLLFIAATVAFARLLSPLAGLAPIYAMRLPVFVMGSLAAFWLLERTAQWLA